MALEGRHWCQNVTQQNVRGLINTMNSRQARRHCCWGTVGTTRCSVDQPRQVAMPMGEARGLFHCAENPGPMSRPWSRGAEEQNSGHHRTRVGHRGESSLSPALAPLRLGAIQPHDLDLDSRLPARGWEHDGQIWLNLGIKRHHSPGEKANSLKN